MEERVRAQIAEMMESAEDVNYSIQLPETEYDVMCAVWNGESPVTTGYLMQVLGQERGWKTPTLISFLQRLEGRGFLASVKNGRERYYFPLAEKKKYKEAVTRRFVERYHDGSFLNLMDALFPSRTMSDADIDALLAWLRSGV